MNRNILGIDASSTSTGYAILRLEDRNLVYLASGFIPLKGDLATRCGKVITKLQKLTLDYNPQYAMIEATFLGVHGNIASVLKLTSAKGAAAGAIAALGIPVKEVVSTVWKNAVIGDPHADKEMTKRSLMMRFAEDESFPKLKSSDESDAIAIAVYLGYQLIGELA